jgi:hypothetical protein
VLQITQIPGLGPARPLGRKTAEYRKDGELA